MANSYYNHGSFPATGSAATSASMRAELQLVGAGFDKLPALPGNQNQLVVVNNTGTGLTSTSVLPALDAVDNTFLIRDNADATRKFRFEVSTVTAGQTRVLTVPDANTTLVGTDTTQTLTNKTLTLPVIAQISNTGTLTLPTSTDTLVGRATTDTLTNKTLTAPVIATIVNVGTLTLPSSTDTLVGRATTDTLTNKTISGASNTLTNIANGSLVNSAVTIGSTSLSLGGTMTALSGVTISGSSNTISNIANASLVNSSVTIGATNVALGATAATVTGLTLTGSAFNGTVGATTPSTGAFTTLSTSGAATLASGTVGGSNIVSETGSQTLTNKTISGSANTLTNIGNASLVNSGLTIGSTNIALGGTATTLTGVTMSGSANTFTNIGNGSLVNSSLTIGSTNIALGATTATLAGLTSVTATTFTGALTGNASTATALATSRSLWGNSFNGTADITGAIQAAAGTVSAPSITTTGDTNTGIYFPAADTIAFTEGGVEAMRIDSSGRTIFGDTSQAFGNQLIQTAGTVNTTVSNTYVWNAQDRGLRLLNLSATNNSAIGVSMYGGSGGGASAGMLLVQETANSLGALSFYTGGAGRSNTVPERMRIDSSGNVGIGTSSPTYKLQIAVGSDTEGILIRRGTGDSSGVLDFSNGFGALARIQGANTDSGAGADDGVLIFSTAVNSSLSERMRITATGNVFIGNGLTAASPTNVILSATGGSGTDIAGASLTIRGGASTGSGAGGPIIFSTAAAGASGTTVRSATERMRLDSTGNLLVGTTTNTNSSRLVANGTISETVGSTQYLVASQYDIGTAPNQIPLNQYLGNLAYQDAENIAGNVGVGGYLLIGRTDITGVGSNTNTLTGTYVDLSGYAHLARNNAATKLILQDTTNRTGTYATFISGSAITGSIDTNGTTTTYATSSDERMKENIAPAGSAGAAIDAIEIVQFDWKVNGSHAPFGVIAQDLQAVAPYAVKQGDTGEQVTNPWGVDYSKLVPMLVKEIQSLRARVAALEAN
jgi:hypothetical protein